MPVKKTTKSVPATQPATPDSAYDMRSAAEVLGLQPEAESAHFDVVVNELAEYTRLGMNVMLIGKHGVGKTSAVKAACEREGWNMWYASAPLLDPDIDLGGIPVPDPKTGQLKFYTQPQLFEAEVIFLDELNRASPRTLNMIFELVQFKSIHGKRLPKLKAVHTGINPPGQGQYDVQTLDDALVDRFHAFVEMKAEFPSEMMFNILGESKALVFKQWWESYTSQVFVSPRRLVYAAEMFAAGMSLQHAFTDPKVPVGRLVVALQEAELAQANIKKAEKVRIDQRPEYLAVLNDPAYAKDNEELERILIKEGITAEEVWAEVERYEKEMEESK